MVIIHCQCARGCSLFLLLVNHASWPNIHKRFMYTHMWETSGSKSGCPSDQIWNDVCFVIVFVLFVYICIYYFPFSGSVSLRSILFRSYVFNSSVSWTAVYAVSGPFHLRVGGRLWPTTPIGGMDHVPPRMSGSSPSYFLRYNILPYVAR